MLLVEPVSSTPFQQGNPADPSTNTVVQEDGRERGMLRAHGYCLSDLALPQSEGAKEQQPCCKT